MSLCVCVPTLAHLFLSVYVYAFTHVDPCMRVCMSVLVSVCVSLRSYVCICVRMSALVFVCVSLCSYACPCVRMSVLVSVCLSLRSYVLTVSVSDLDLELVYATEFYISNGRDFLWVHPTREIYLFFCNFKERV